MLDQPKLREECGVMGVWHPNADVARLTYFGQFALQHRGQESAGIAVWNEGTIKYHKGMGLVHEVFRDEHLKALTGTIAVGHNRYSTTGSSSSLNIGPFIERGVSTETGNTDVALSHNGNVVNATSLRRELEADGITFASSTDSEVLSKSLVSTFGKTWIERIQNAACRWNGAYSLTIIAEGKLYGVRDPLGFRPLCLGRLHHSGWVLASESSALYTIGADFIRDIEPGEIVVIDESGVKSSHIPIETPHRGFCMFEYVYLARPDSVINGHTVYKVRKEQGKILAREHPVDADLVIPVPDSGIPAAIGYAEESGIPFGEGLIKNRYIGRTFIKPDQHLREQGIKLKLNVLKYEITGKRLVLVDDSIVRGNTTKHIVSMLKQAGATEVHLRISSSPIIAPCYFGVDISSKQELIAAKQDIPSIQKHTEADSLGYISIEGMIKATGMTKKDFCLGCFTDRYPLPVQLTMDKLILET